MFSFRRAAMLAVTAAMVAAGQPALTTIQDILYRADGTRFSGTLFITYNAFQAGDTSNIATANLTLAIVNGVLKVALVPTTTASAGAQYNITFNSGGVNQFTQVWAVPPSSTTLTVRDVLVSQGTVVGPPPDTSAIQISDVTGLQNQLTIRPQEGVGFTLGRAAVINTSGQIDGAAGNLSDCVRVDGSSGPCGGGSGGVLPSFSDGETPGGTINGSNPTFTLSFAPSPAASLDLYLNGLLMKQGTDYTVSGNTISFLAASTPQAGDLMAASYRYANPSNPLGTLASPQVICSAAGSSTSATTLTQLGSCTIPAGLLTAGDRIEVQFQYSHSGSATGFTGQVNWAGTSTISRSAASGENALVGKMAFGIYTGGQSWDGQSWGTSLAVAVTTGATTADITQNLTVALEGLLASATSDSLILRNFTVIRYPAQTNP